MHYRTFETNTDDKKITEQTINRYMKQWCPSLLTHVGVTRPKWVKSEPWAQDLIAFLGCCLLSRIPAMPYRLPQIDGLMHRRRNLSAFAMELRFCCIKPSIWSLGLWVNEVESVGSSPIFNMTYHGRDGVPYQWQLDCFFNNLLRLTTNKTPKLRILLWGLGDYHKMRQTFPCHDFFHDTLWHRWGWSFPIPVNLIPILLIKYC